MSSRTHRLLLADVSPGEHPLGQEQCRYLRSVLRLRVGDEVEVFDGKGKRAKAAIVELSRHVAKVCVEATPLSVAASSSPSKVVERCKLTMAIAVPKGSRSDWLVEKLTELGVARIVWVVCERSNYVVQQGGAKVERWQRLAESALQQSGRTTMPSLEGPVPLKSFFDTLPAQVNSRSALHGSRFVADFTDATLFQQLAKLDADDFTQAAVSPAEVTLLIGPEGGFDAAELDLARANGFVGVRLGPHVLRIETAAVAAAAIVQSL